MASYEHVDDEDPILVYQCAKCLTIVGDSLLEKESNEELGVVGLTKVCPDVIVKADPNLEHRSGVDEGCTYRMLKCKCDQPIGKMYLKTTKKLQNLVNLYCIKQNQIVTYRVGVAQTVSPREREKDDSIRESFAKMEKMIMIFHSRLKNLEDSLEPSEDGGESIREIRESKRNATLSMSNLQSASTKRTDSPRRKRL